MTAMKFFDPLQPLALLLMRIAAGAVLAMHGWAKILDHVHSHIHLVQSLNLPGWLAYVSTATEFVGGLLLIAGLLTRFAALAATINMAVAVALVHWPHGLTGPGGYQFPLAILALCFALLALGAGPISLDRGLLHHRWG